MQRCDLPAPFCRFVPAGSLLVAFLAMSCFYFSGDGDLYESILRAYGIVPFRFPFVDIGGALAGWECVRQGIDIVLYNPCDVLGRGYNYSPIWFAAAAIPLNVSDRPFVGWALDVLFILSLTLLPTPKGRLELVLVLAATMSTMIVFALERANPDVFLFLMALAAGFLAQGRLSFRLFGYGIVLLAGLIKYYPIMGLFIVFRERSPVLVPVALIILGVLGLFWWGYRYDVFRGMPTIATGAYNTDLFAAKNLPFLIGMMVEDSSAPLRSAAEFGWAVSVGLYACLLGAALAICRRVFLLLELTAATGALSARERMPMVIGSAVVAGCFFAGQSIGYRGVFLLLVLPGLLALSRCTATAVRALSIGTAIIIVLLMWGECIRHALGVGFACRFVFWFVRELGWWWSVGVMLALVADFLREAPILNAAFLLIARQPLRAR
jgi:hypothetical protein